MQNVYLYGPPASGKSTLARALAARLNAPRVDLDEEIVRRAGRSIPAIFAQSGESAFRALERETLAGLASASESGIRIVALGGGTLLDETNRSLCERTGTVVCLEAPPPEELARRIGANAGSRPLGDRARERAAHYASFPARLAATFALDDSLVLVGTGYAAALLGNMPFVVDATVADLYADRFGASQGARVAVIPSGESHKTPQTVIDLWHAFAVRGLGRRDRIAAVGGGVTGDLAGFAAATWMRGIAWINVPTTLLAMVDASTGGKTGCDLAEGKNLAGAFHSPRLVLIDTDFLKTLPPAILAAGRAEMIKHEAIGGLRSGDRPTGLPTASEIAANLAVKVGIVREDPFEKNGRRLLLNCGHTVAHAVEKLTRYGVSHGEAVSIGCVEEARLAVRLGLAPAAWPDELAARFAAAGLPTALPEGLSFASMRSVMRGDKKRRGDIVTFALPCGWGDVRAVDVDLSAGDFFNSRI